MRQKGLTVSCRWKDTKVKCSTQDLKAHGSDGTCPGRETINEILS